MKYLHAINKLTGIGPQKMQLLLDHFGDAESAWKADLPALKNSKIGDKLAEKIIEGRKKIDPDKEWEMLRKENVNAVSLGDNAYPKLLREIHRPPHIIYTRGELNLNYYPLISIVGSRKFTPYGEQSAARLASDLAKAGFIVVSGLAIGIDAIAHQSTLDSQGKTVAVLGSSPDEKNIYPRANLRLAKEIIGSGGMLLSEYPPETPASNVTFPARNRIIAGLSLGTIVIEASEKSGALITSSYALEFNRQVFAVPGNIFSDAARGSNQLIKNGAKLVSGISDILEEFNFAPARKEKEISAKIPESPEEEKILNLLSTAPTHINNLAKMTKLGTATVSSILSIMEIKGWAKNIGGQNYIIQ